MTARSKYVQQAYASVLAPVGRGMQIDVGKFNTPIGAEPTETAYNWNYSRSLLFAWAAPYYHMGVRAALPVSDTVTVTAFPRERLEQRQGQQRRQDRRGPGRLEGHCRR